MAFLSVGAPVAAPPLAGPKCSHGFDEIVQRMRPFAVGHDLALEPSKLIVRGRGDGAPVLDLGCLGDIPNPPAETQRVGAQHPACDGKGGFGRPSVQWVPPFPWAAIGEPLLCLGTAFPVDSFIGEPLSSFLG